MKTILIIGYVWPEPNSSAAGCRMLQLIELFRQQVWKIIFASPATAGSHKVNLEEIGVCEQSIELNSSSFDEFIRACQPDIVLFDRFMMEEQFGWRVEKQCPQACRILNTEDLHFLRQARQQAIKQKRELQTRDLRSEVALREVASILRCDLTLMISSFETRLLADSFQVPAQLLHDLPFMLTQIERYTIINHDSDFHQRQHFIFIGNFRHAPNWDAVLQLKDIIWPIIKNQLPQAELHIYGAYPPPKAMALHNPKQGFLIKGWAENARQVMQQARLCLAPLRFGAGIKGKLTDAMQYGTPSITTTTGAEAMHGDLPWNGVITDDPVIFAEAAVALYTDEIRWRESRQNGFEIINQHYDKTRLGREFITRLEQLTNNLTEERQTNFTGAMLRHHSMKSTQYMSQWIEAKNTLKQIHCEHANKSA